VRASTLLRLSALMLLPCWIAGAQRPAERRCQLEILNVDREGAYDRFGDNTNYFAGGNVRLRCIGQQVFLNADSMASIAGSVVQLFTDARYRDDDVDIRADTLTYYRTSETLQARGSVRIINKLNGSTLEGPWVDYLRSVRGVRDSAETTALNRPTVTYKVPRAEGDTVDPSPYVIVADGMRARGSSNLNAWGDVLVDRDSLSGRGDSLRYARGENDEVTLIGRLASFTRRGVDSFDVRGRHVVLGLAGEALKSVKAFGEGRILGSTGEIIADSSALEFEDGQLVATRAWDHTTTAQVLAGGYDVRGDSVAIDTPGERLRELRVFGSGKLIELIQSDSAVRDAEPDADSLRATPDSAVVEEVPDSLAPIRNTMTGERLVVRFVDHDSLGTVVSRLVDITAIGNATSLFERNVVRDGRTSPSINYTKADTIIIVMKVADSTGVEEVRAFGNVDGLQLEQETIRRRRVTMPGLGTPRREDIP
jgi:hypothetical protein